MKTFTVYTDPGHGWVKVPISLLHILDIADKITTFSYRKDDHAYLEEDMDASTFIQAYKKKYGHPPKIITAHTDRSSRIRSYPFYHPMGMWKY